MKEMTVFHIIYGRCTVCEQNEQSVRVLFDRTETGIKSFVYPDAFGHFLRFEDESLQKEVLDRIEQIRQEEKERILLRAAERAAAMEETKKHQKKLASAKRKAAAKPSLRSGKKKADSSSAEEPDDSLA